MSKVNIWVTADWHFNHFNIIDYCNRPFKNQIEMNTVLITNHNKLVKDQDIVYVLGDIGTGSNEEMRNIISSLKGIKILVRGNHDTGSVSSYLKMGFVTVLDHVELQVGKKRVHMRHVPTRTKMQFIKLCKIWIKQMRARKRTWKQIWQRIKTERKYFRGVSEAIVLCGHVHNSWTVRHNNINVGVDVRDFKPVKLYSLIN